MKRDLQILLVEENKYHALLMEREIRQRYGDSSVVILRSGKEALEAVQTKSFDVAVVDFDMPDYAGLVFIELLRKDDVDLPVIAVTTDSSEQLAREASRLGIGELLVKDSSFHVTIPRLIGEVYRRRMLVLENRALEERLKEKDHAELIRMTVGTLSHEINNPLMSILGTTELILDNGDKGDRELAKKLRVIQKSARQIQSSLKRLSRITEPGVRHTASGKMIDPWKSRVRAKASF